MHPVNLQVDHFLPHYIRLDQGKRIDSFYEEPYNWTPFLFSYSRATTQSPSTKKLDNPKSYSLSRTSKSTIALASIAELSLASLKYAMITKSWWSWVTKFWWLFHYEGDGKGWLWTRIFHVRPHSIGETSFLFICEKLIF